MQHTACLFNPYDALKADAPFDVSAIISETNLSRQFEMVALFSSHSKTTITFHPVSRSIEWFFLSRPTFTVNFFIKHCFIMGIFSKEIKLVFGILAAIFVGILSVILVC